MKNPGTRAPLTYEPVRAPRGATLSCQGWVQEAALRMLMNSLDPEVAERPEDLVVCCGTAKPARNWDCFRAITGALRELPHDRTLLVQSGKPVAMFRTFPEAPRVLVANSNLVGHWDHEQEFARLQRDGLTMFGGVLPGNWLHVGTQGILPTACEIFSAAARKHFDGTLAGKLVVSGGMGSAGGAHALAATLNGAAFLGIDPNPERIKRRVRAGYCEIMVTSLDEALRILKNAVYMREPASVGLTGNCADLLPELASRGVIPDLLTDMTPAQHPLQGYIPQGLTPKQSAELWSDDATAHRERALGSIARHVTAMLELQKLGTVVFDSGNNLRALGRQCGVANADRIPGAVPEYLRPLLCEGRTPLLWVALSGDPRDISCTDQLLLNLFPAKDAFRTWASAFKRVRNQGLPARTCWLDAAERAEFGLALNGLVAQGKVGAPFLLGSGHIAGIPAASPYADTEKMPDGSDAISDWPLLAGMLAAAGGAAWISIQSGGTGIGNALHTTQAFVADGARETGPRIERLLSNEAGMNLVRLADAGYRTARDAASKCGIKMPLL